MTETKTLTPKEIEALVRKFTGRDIRKKTKEQPYVFARILTAHLLLEVMPQEEVTPYMGFNRSLIYHYMGLIKNDRYIKDMITEFGLWACRQGYVAPGY